MADQDRPGKLHPSIASDMSALRRMLDLHPHSAVIADATDPHMPMVYTNQAFERMTGYNASDVIGRNCSFLQRGDTDQPGLRLLREALTKKTGTEVVLRNYRKSGEMFINQLSLSPMQDPSGENTYFVGLARDVTREKRLEEELIAANSIDPLTRALNRQHFWEVAEMMFRRARIQEEPLSVIKLDIDHFHTVNDAYGLKAGDQILKDFVRTAKSQLRPTDAIARIGSDEFAILMPNSTLGAARGVAKAIRKKQEDAVSSYGDIAIKVTVSAGVSECIYEVETLDYALYRADQAMMEAQERGHNRVASF